MKKKSDDSTKIVPSRRERNNEELEQLMLKCIVMRFSEKESIAYIKSNGKNIESSRYYEIKKLINDQIITEGYKITSENGLFEQHMKRIHTLETIEQEQWINYHTEKKPILKSLILTRIETLQVYLSSAYDYIRAIIKNQVDLQLIISKHIAPKLESQ